MWRPGSLPTWRDFGSEASLAIPYHTGFALPWPHQGSGPAPDQLCPATLYPACTQTLHGVRATRVEFQLIAKPPQPSQVETQLGTFFNKGLTQSRNLSMTSSPTQTSARPYAEGELLALGPFLLYASLRPTSLALLWPSLLLSTCTVPRIGPLLRHRLELWCLGLRHCFDTTWSQDTGRYLDSATLEYVFSCVDTETCGKSALIPLCCGGAHSIGTYMFVIVFCYWCSGAYSMGPTHDKQEKKGEIKVGKDGEL
ncbi:hypothetical protein JCGZ_20050 [Jatropha curcas]|uniref:Uncharacterized protein n=1 Tax=Jatropha curcas TaxID=180498 RepID=A0A067LIE0_JATCU|nr:hypothetical protein JCGZ_20050 [Jatropha curcas]